MFAMLGMYVQAITTGKGPVANWSEHIADPGAVNAWNYATKFTPTLQRMVRPLMRSHPVVVWRSTEVSRGEYRLISRLMLTMWGNYAHFHTGKLQSDYQSLHVDSCRAGNTSAIFSRTILRSKQIIAE